MKQGRLVGEGEVSEGFQSICIIIIPIFINQRGRAGFGMNGSARPG